MGKFFAIIFILIFIAILWCLPLWLVVNFICWVFHLSFRLTVLQAFALCLASGALRKIYFKEDE